MERWTPGMMVDVGDSRWTKRERRPRRPPVAATLDPAALVALSLEASPLLDLREWPPAGALLETLAEAAAGTGGITRKDADRIRRWANRWARLVPRLRGFYRSVLTTLSHFIEHGADRRMEQQAVNKALWRIFEGYEVPGWAQRRLVELWEEHEGSLPLYQLAPRGACGTSYRPKR